MSGSRQDPRASAQSAFDPGGPRLTPIATWTPFAMPVPTAQRPRKPRSLIPGRPGRTRQDPRRLETPPPAALTIWTVPIPSSSPPALDAPTPHIRRMHRLARAIDAIRAPIRASTKVAWSLVGLVVGATALAAAITTFQVATTGDARLRLTAPGGAYAIDLAARPAPPDAKAPRAAP